MECLAGFIGICSWENGYNESFNGTLRNELDNWEVFHKLAEAKVQVGRWRKEYNHRRPNSSLGYRPPAPETVVLFEELVVKIYLTGERSKVEYCRLNYHSTWI